MIVLNVGEARKRISELLDRVVVGEKVVITRHGQPAAHLVAPPAISVQFPDRSALRSALPPMRESAACTVRDMRDEEAY